MASCFYGISMVVMMLMSCVYHAMPAGSGAKRVCRRFDLQLDLPAHRRDLRPHSAGICGRRAGHGAVLPAMGRDLVRGDAAGGVRTGALAGLALHPLFPDRLERERRAVRAHLFPQRPDAAVVHPGGRIGLYAGDDPFARTESTITACGICWCWRPPPCSGWGSADLDREQQSRTAFRGPAF